MDAKKINSKVGDVLAFMETLGLDTYEKVAVLSAASETIKTIAATEILFSVFQKTMQDLIGNKKIDA